MIDVVMFWILDDKRFSFKILYACGLVLRYFLHVAWF